MTLETFARSEFAAVFIRRMTLKTGGVRRLCIWNSKCRAVSARFMTGRAICFSMQGMIKANAKTSRRADLFVTSPAVVKIRRAESTLIIMTSSAAIGLTRVHPDRNFRHFIARPRRIMTTLTIQTAVFVVREVKSDLLRRINNPIRRSRNVTGRAGTDIFFADDLISSMALKTGRMSITARWNCHSVTL